MGKKDKKIKRKPQKESTKDVGALKVLEETKNCKVEVMNNMLPWERDVMSEHSIINFKIKGGKSFKVSYDEKNKALNITCDDSPCNIQPMSPNHFLIK